MEGSAAATRLKNTDVKAKHKLKYSSKKKSLRFLLLLSTTRLFCSLVNMLWTTYRAWNPACARALLQIRSVLYVTARKGKFRPQTLFNLSQMFQESTSARIASTGLSYFTYCELTYESVSEHLACYQWGKRCWYQLLWAGCLVSLLKVINCLNSATRLKSNLCLGKPICSSCTKYFLTRIKLKITNAAGN